MKLKYNSFLYAIIYAIAILLIVAWLSGCSNTRKNAKAFSRVLSNQELFKRMCDRCEREYPCIPAHGIPGKDSIRIDTVFSNDFVFGKDSVRVDSFESVVTKTVIKKVPVYITKTIQRVDTVPDLRRIAAKDAEINKLLGQADLLNVLVKKERKRGNKWMWIAIVGFALYVGTRFIKNKPKWL